MSVIRSFAGMTAFVVAAYLTVAAPAKAATDETAAAQFIEGIATQTIDILKSDMSDNDRQKALGKLLSDNVAIKQIGRAVAGQYIRRMNKKERARYDRMYREWVIKQVVSRFKGYAGQGWVLKNTYRRKNDVIVRTLITKSDGSDTVNCDWRVRSVKGKLLILDVAVSGLSMAATQKSEFAAVFSKGGVSGVLAQLETQIGTD